VELASVLGQRRRKGEMTLKDAIGILNDFAALPLVVVPAIALVAPALALMERISCSIYDGIYLALAEQLGVPLVTADRKLAQAARADPHGPPIRLLAEMG
jgi:predicted nucleic acid-binding protein